MSKRGSGVAGVLIALMFLGCSCARNIEDAAQTRMPQPTHAGAIDPDPVRTPFRLIYDAAEVQQIIAALNSGAVNLWRVEVPDDRIRFPIGHVLYLDHPAVSDSAVPALVAGVTLNAATRRVTYLLVA